MQGGLGNDVYYVDDALDLIVEAGGAGTDEARTTISYTLGAGVDNLLLLGSSAINGTGNAGANTLTGNGADNSLSGAGPATPWSAMAATTRSTAAPAPTPCRRLGDDIYIVDNAGDQAIERAGEGFDTVQSSVSYTLGAMSSG